MGGCCGKGKTNAGDDEIDLKSAIDGKKKMCVWILGGPGSGKGTQCAKLAERYKLAHLSTGDLLRKITQEDNDLSRQIKETMEQGGLVDTSTVLQLLINAMKDAYATNNGFLIDGYPREVEQGVQFCEKIGTPHIIIYLDCPDDVLMERLLKRGQQSGRVDDNEETIGLRLQTFHNISKPVIKKWSDKVVSVDGTLGAEDVTKDCCATVAKIEGDFTFN